MEKGLTLETLPIEEYKAICDKFETDVFEAITLEACVNGRSTYGGPAAHSVESQIRLVRKALQKEM